MKNVLKSVVESAIVCAVLTLVPGIAGARVGDVGVGGSLGFATSPGYYDYGIGFPYIGVGGGYVVAGNFVPNREDGIEVRGEIGWVGWSRYGVTVSDVPLFALARYIFPINPRFRVFGQAGFSINFFSASVPQSCYPGPYGPVCSGGGSASETDLGLVFGAGLEYLVMPNLGVGGDFRYSSIAVKYGNADHALFEANVTYYFSTRPAPAAPVRRAPYHRR